MRNKNTIVTLLVIFTLICFYNLYWTYVQFSKDSERDNLSDQYSALQLAKPDPRSWNSEDSMIEREYTTLLNDEDFQASYKKAVENSFTLGLDLQGGMFVTLEVSVDDVIRQLASNPQDTSLNRALKCAFDRQASQSASYVSLFVQCFRELYPNQRLSLLFSSEERNISISTSDSEVEQMLDRESKAAIDRTFNIIRTRIDQFGVVSPNLQKQEGTGRILLELPGVREPERVRQLLRGTAKLEFYTCTSAVEAYPTLQLINDKLKALRGLLPDSSAAPADSTAALADSSALAARPDSAAADSSESLASLLEADSAKPFDQLSPDEQEARRQQFNKENPLFALLKVSDLNAFYQAGSKNPFVGAALARDTAAINQIFRQEEIKPLIPQRLRFAWTFKPWQDGADEFGLIALEDEGAPALGGDAVSVARQDFDPSNGQPVVSIRMTPEGSRKWAQITEAAAPKGGGENGGHIAILLDNLVYSYPVVNEPIRGGNTQISGGFAIEEAKDLANVLKAGQLPVRTRIAGEETVGPSLGVENINSGLRSFLIALMVILAFMGFYYGRAGLVANVALIANLIFLLGCSAALTIVLTLPGIAAVVLTIGMAVDANVLIFERVREELKKDKTLKAAIKAGFSHAFSSVMDSNITTFLTGLILFAFGVGPIRGFAVSLMIGIITSLISALIITRLILEYYANRGNNALNFGFPWTVGLFDKAKLYMSRNRRIFYGVSGALVLVSLISFFTIGFKTGVDFQGGRQFVVEFLTQDNKPAALSPAEVNDIRAGLTQAFTGEAPVVKTLSSSNQLQITSSYKVNDRDATTEVSNTLEQGLKQSVGQYTAKIRSVMDVGPTVASDIRSAAIYSVIFSLLVIFLYILIRFRKWQYSLGAVIATAHDVIVTLGVFSLLSALSVGFNVEIDQAMIAAILTIIGYSINDTVIVFDRIRENLQENKTLPIRQVFDDAIDHTISRTIITSLTTLFTAFVLFLFGGDVIKGFVFAIIVGVAFGTYSSVFVASALALDLQLREKKAPEAEAGKTA